MKNTLIAALLLSSAVFAAPVFAAGNANLGDDVQNWEGPSVLTRAQVRDQLIASEKANQYAHTDDNLSYPVLTDNGPGKTRAQVMQELADAAAQGQRNLDDNLSYPAEPAYAAAHVTPVAQTAVAQGNGSTSRSNP